MNLPTEPTDLPPPSPEEVAARQPQPQPSKHPSWKIVGIAAAVLLGIGVLGAISDSDDDSTASAKSASTGDASVDEKIVDTVWASMKGELCPAFRRREGIAAGNERGRGVRHGYRPGGHG